MKLTENINLGGMVFTIDDDALLKLQNYLNSIERHFGAKEESEEILADIESRMAELFQSQIQRNKEVVSMPEVDKAIEILGLPEEFIPYSSKKTFYNRSSGNPNYRRLYRDTGQRILGGVCSGIANYFNIDPVIIRVLFVLLAFFAAGGLIYIILWIVLTPAVYAPDNMEMKSKHHGFGR
jgi:phage shock protein PspC (stress-responsive transcriptional regulator)